MLCKSARFTVVGILIFCSWEKRSRSGYYSRIKLLKTQQRILEEAHDPQPRPPNREFSDWNVRLQLDETRGTRAVARIARKDGVKGCEVK